MNPMIELFLAQLSQQADLSEENKEKIRTACAKETARFPEMAWETKLVTQSQALRALGKLYALPFMDVLGDLTPGTETEIADKISRKFLKTNCIVPLMNKNRDTVIAVNDPSDLIAVDEVAKLADVQAYSLVLAPKDQILMVINMLYDHAGEDVRQLVDDMEEDDSLFIEDMDQTADLLDDTSDAPVIRLVNQMISQSVKAGASDIHIEPFQDELIIRYRIDGILYEMMTPPKIFQSALISRIKVMAKM